LAALRRFARRVAPPGGQQRTGARLSNVRRVAIHLRGVFLPDDSERDAWVIDGRLTFSRPSGETDTVATGGWITPGFVDAHCHIGLAPTGWVPEHDGQVRQALADRAAGALLLRDAGSPVDNRGIQAHDDLPRLIRAGRHIARPKRYIRGLGVEVEPEDLVAEVERQAAAGDGWVKIAADWIDRDVGDLAPAWPDDALKAGIGRAHELGVRVAAHVFGEEALPGLIAAGIDSIEHGTGLTDELISAAKAAGCAVVPTLINIDNFPQIAVAGAEKFPSYAAHMRSLFATSRERIRSAYEAGVPIYTGTDAGGSLPHGLVRDEIRALVGAGIPQPEVIAQASWRAREWLGLPGLVEGAPADLVVYDTDPRVDLAAVVGPRRMMIRGKVVL
jgi:imidazolonepropionase-like amidohydrolase